MELATIKRSSPLLVERTIHFNGSWVDSSGGFHLSGGRLSSGVAEGAMGNRKTPPLAFWGEYVSPDNENSEDVYRARLRLMETVKQIFPTFLERLSSEVFPSYSQLAQAGKLAKDG